MHTLPSFTLCCALFFALIAPAQSEDWPKGYIVAKGSESPDGRYGILIESKQSALAEMDAADATQPPPDASATASQTPDNKVAAATEDADEPDEDEGADEDEGSVNYMADLKSHRIIGKIKGSDYFQGQNHAGFTAQWSSDSKLCVAQYDGRYGFYQVDVLEPRGDHFEQVEIGKKIHDVSDAATKKASGDGVDLQPYFRFEPGSKIRVRAVGQDNPKQLDPKTHYILFRGTYDYPAKKWTAAEARSISSELSDELGYAFGDPSDKGIFVGETPPEDFEGTIVKTEEEKTQLLDEQLNHVYAALRMVLPPAEFARVRADEKEWVKKLEALEAAPEKSALIVARIKTLQDTLWK